MEKGNEGYQPTEEEMKKADEIMDEHDKNSYPHLQRRDSNLREAAYLREHEWKKLPPSVKKYFEDDPDNFFHYGMNDLFYHNPVTGETGSLQTGLGGEYRDEQLRVENDKNFDKISNGDIDWSQKELDYRIDELAEKKERNEIGEVEYNTELAKLRKAIDEEEYLPDWYKEADLKAKTQFFLEEGLPLSDEGIKILQQKIQNKEIDRENLGFSFGRNRYRSYLK